MCLVGSRFCADAEDRLLRPVTAWRAWRSGSAPHSTGWRERAVAMSGRGVGAACGGEGSPGCGEAAPQNEPGLHYPGTPASPQSRGLLSCGGPVALPSRGACQSGVPKSEDPWTRESPMGKPQQGHRPGRVSGWQWSPVCSPHSSQECGLHPGELAGQACPEAMSWVGLWAGGHF